jgi:hypothetical protein
LIAAEAVRKVIPSKSTPFAELGGAVDIVLGMLPRRARLPFSGGCRYSPGMAATAMAIAAVAAWGADPD